jgi:sulfopyruvate decarboxylase TPP-binding subunit
VIAAGAFWGKLKSSGFSLFSGVPDSTFGLSYNALADDRGIRFVPAVREDVALGIAGAAPLCGQRGAVVIQNSGIGNVVNALTSFNLVYGVPALLVIGWRGHQGADRDAPEHSVMGLKSQALLDLLDVPNRVLDGQTWERQVDELVARMDAQQTPVALLVPPGSLRE